MKIVNLEISRIALHQIFKLNEETERYRLNEALTALESSGLGVLKTRLVAALGEDSKSIELQIKESGQGSSFQTISKMIYDDDIEFITASQDLAKKLADAQKTTSIPGGILVVINGTFGNYNKNFMAIMKAESQEGFALNSSNRAIDLQYIAQLLLTRTQKLYKVALFVENETLDDNVSLRATEEFEVMIYDNNMSHTDTQNAAIYFYKDFLGCDLMPSNKKLTRDFYFKTKEFINDTITNDEDKLDLQSSLYDYLKVSRESLISTAAFAETYFERGTADKYRLFMAGKNFPTNAISKDISLIKPCLRRRKLLFSTDVKITAPADNFSELVIREECDDAGYTRMKIKGKIQDQ